MAARRLLIVMLMLLGISSVIAVMVPEPGKNDSTSQDSGTTGEMGESATEESEASEETDSGGGLSRTIRESVSMDASKPAEIGVAASSRMILTVDSKDGSDVEISGLGLAGFADPYAPAVFDVILPPEPGRYTVRAPGEDPAAVIVARSGSRG